MHTQHGLLVQDAAWIPPDGLQHLETGGCNFNDNMVDASNGVEKNTTIDFFFPFP